MIKKEGSSYCVYDHTGKKMLGKHKTRAEAVNQLQAIEASKARKHAARNLGKKSKPPREITYEMDEKERAAIRSAAHKVAKKD